MSRVESQHQTSLRLSRLQAEEEVKIETWRDRTYVFADGRDRAVRCLDESTWRKIMAVVREAETAHDLGDSVTCFECKAIYDLRQHLERKRK